MAPKLYVMYASPPCRSALMVAKAIGIELEVEKIDQHQLREPELLQLNPQHTVPFLVDGDFALSDSHAIAGYLVAKYAENDSLYPKDDLEKRSLIDHRLHFDNGTLFIRFVAVFTPLYLGVGEASEEARDKVIEAYGFLEAFLDGRSWFVGDEMTIADLSLLGTMSSVEIIVPVEEDRFPNLKKWLETGKSLEYFEECNSIGLEKLRELAASTAPLD